MATAAQIAANQANARRSTKPRTAEGKTASARNATTHGLSFQDFVVLAGQEEEFDQFMADLEAEIQPAGAIERSSSPNTPTPPGPSAIERATNALLTAEAEPLLATRFVERDGRVARLFAQRQQLKAAALTHHGISR
ncbi:MAG: hypothetical protein IPP47_13345 [Bryobacterales bacterium]|nr:hypothetical protein [Bryobacterales bacterium]